MIENLIKGRKFDQWSNLINFGQNRILSTTYCFKLWWAGPGESVEREQNRVSLCFHPTDNLLLIAISNELHLWDWSIRKEPFAIIKTGSEFEKIRYCRFSPDGGHLVTAITLNEQHHIDAVIFRTYKNYVWF